MKLNQQNHVTMAYIPFLELHKLSLSYEFLYSLVDFLMQKTWVIDEDGAIVTVNLSVLIGKEQGKLHPT